MLSLSLLKKKEKYARVLYIYKIFMLHTSKLFKNFHQKRILKPLFCFIFIIRFFSRAQILIARFLLMK